MPIPAEYLEIKCLVVDDESSMLRTISNMLARIGFKSVVSAENGKKALEIIKAKHVDMVIADVLMPEMTGIELFKTIREDRNYDHIIFIFVTAEATRRTVARAAEEGGEGYIIKPFVMGVLEDKIARALENKFKPGSLETCLKDFVAAMAKKDYHSAEEALCKASALAPDAAKVMHNFGVLALAKGNVDRAIECYKEAIKKNPMYVKSYNALGEIYENMGDLGSAIKYYKYAHNISPANTERVLVLSKLFYKAGEKDQAETILKDAVSNLREDMAESAHLLGEIYLAKNEREKALEILKKAYKQNPTDIYIMESLAEAYRRMAQPQPALELYKDCLKISPDNSQVYYSMSKTYLETSDKTNAIETLKKAWVLNPHSKEITADLKALAEKERLRL
ncbi:MAG: response regulator [Nitrospirae bacterium]|nr:response regulator [Nitrospirota bacterium]